jgi:uncharacterized membrane protein YphA (DoxX/SURF4 family)
MFIAGGIDSLRNPSGPAKAAAPVIDKIDEVAEPVVDATPMIWDDETYVRANGAVQVGAGLLLAAGKAPRVASAALAASLVPTTLGGHRFWEYEGDERRAQRIHFLKNVSMLGGLILAAADTEGRPGLAWRARHARDTAKVASKAARANAAIAARAAKADAKAARRLAKANAKVAGKGGKLGLELAAAKVAALAPVVSAAGHAAVDRAHDAAGRAAVAGDRAAAAAAPRLAEVGHVAQERAADLAPKVIDLTDAARGRAAVLAPKVLDLAHAAQEKAAEVAPKVAPMVAELRHRAADALPVGA